MKMFVKKLIPLQIRLNFRNLYNGLLDFQNWDRSSRKYPDLGWYIHPKALTNRLRLLEFKDSHKGERCFIIGNGPSLNLMDLSPLINEVTFGTNKIYLLFPKIGFQTSYYVAVNNLVIGQTAQEINNLLTPKFISWHAKKYIGWKYHVYYLRDARDGTNKFTNNLAWRIWEGATVTYVALQIAYYMGFSQVILIGVDHSFTTQGLPHSEIISTGNDPNHFDPSYFGKGFKWQLPDLKTSEESYRLAKQAFESDGREVLDATVQGNLQVFRKVDFNSLF